MKIDLHVHSSEVSLCGVLTAAQTAQMYRAAGYDVIVLTNHYNRDTADHYARHGRPDFAALYRQGYELAKAEGEKVGLRVLCGYEIRFDGAFNDYLVYGLPDDLAADPFALFGMGPRDFGKLAAERGFLFYQAHPFRNGMQIQRPDSFFGIEVRNGNPRHDSRNDIAALWAKKFGLHAIAGSDCHESTDVGVTGIETAKSVVTMDDLIEVLRGDDYTLL